MELAGIGEQASDAAQLLVDRCRHHALAQAMVEVLVDLRGRDRVGVGAGVEERHDVGIEVDPIELDGSGPATQRYIVEIPVTQFAHRDAGGRACRRRRCSPQDLARD